MPKMEEDKVEEVVEEAIAEEAVADEIISPLNPDKEVILPLKSNVEEIKTEVLAVKATITQARVEESLLIKPTEAE